MPLVNHWGFGYSGRNKVTKIDSGAVHDILESVGLEHILVEKFGKKRVLTKLNPEVELDFSAVAKGYALDIIGNWLVGNGCERFLIDIGGEMLARGMNGNNSPWVVGINTPDSNADISEIMAKVPLENVACATSGNYRNFYELDGKIIGHTINPKTGFPEINNLLSVSILAPTCAEADAFATACLAMGHRRAEAL